MSEPQHDVDGTHGPERAVESPEPSPGAPPPGHRSNKSVQFDLPEKGYLSDSELSRPSSSSRQSRHSRRQDDDAANDSDETIDLPDRFDREGRPKNRQDSVANAVESFLMGRNGAGAKFHDVVDDFLGVPHRRRRSSR